MTDKIISNCKICDNTCEIIISPSYSKTLVSGNQCLRGFAFANRTFGDEIPGEFVQNKFKYSDSEFKMILDHWDLEFSQLIPEIIIQGSPERSEFRIVIDDKNGNRYLLEQINSLNVERKEQIAQFLDELENYKLPITNYIKQYNDSHVVKYKNRYWMLSPFISGIPLNREKYWNEGWRGTALANFLIDLKKSATYLTVGKNVFNLPKYINDLVKSIKNYDDQVYSSILPIYDHVKLNLYPHYNSIPVSFCHGDPHPVNIIWGKKKINAVIDWEFSGLKPEIYDIALIIGCVGSEAKDALFGNFIKEFLKILKKELFSENLSWQLLPDFIIALRFAWLSEWFRKQDEEMIQFEIRYMKFLDENLSKILCTRGLNPLPQKLLRNTKTLSQFFILHQLIHPE